MKRKKVVLLLSAILALTAGNYAQINAEDVFENSLGKELENKTPEAEDDSVLSAEGESADFTSDGEAGSSTQESEESFADEKTLTSDEENTSISEESASTENEAALPEVIPDDTYNLKFFAGSVERSDIFVGDDAAETLNVYDGREEQNKLVKGKDYTVLGYITEGEYLNADHTLDNLNQFCKAPDTAGVWYLVFEGITPYYGRQAVRIVMHDTTDISMYGWRIEGDILAGENPADALQVFLENGENHNVLGQDDYVVLGYITENEYANAQYDVEKIAAFNEIPSQAGQWVMVIEGRNPYHGKLTAMVTVKDEYDLGMYQCSLEKERIKPEEDIQNYIKIVRGNSDSEKVVPADQYKILGVIKEKDFAANGYDVNNTENIQDFADTPGGWYVLLEGTNLYYGRMVVWFEVEENEILE